MNVSALFDDVDNNSHYATLLTSFVLIWLWDPKQQNLHSVHLLKGCDCLDTKHLHFLVLEIVSVLCSYCSVFREKKKYKVLKFSKC